MKRLVLAAIVAASAFSMRELPGLGIFSPMILAVIVGIAFGSGKNVELRYCAEC